MRDFATHPRLRAATLVICGTGAIIRGIAYISGPKTAAYTTIVDTWVPLRLWAVVWMAAGAVMVAGIWHRDIARLGLAIGVGLWGTWAISYFVSWIVSMFADAPGRGWVTGAAFAMIAGLHWIVMFLAERSGPGGRR